MSLHTLTLRYAAFAILATAANVAAQRAVLVFDASAFGFAAAVLTGTAVGLIVKYLLDKRWIFYDFSAEFKTHGRKFALYTALGVLTTLIFWGTETAFWVIWKSDVSREIGAVLGLAVGYVTKYNLDRRYVFADTRLSPREAG